MRPASVAELGEIVRRAAAEGHALYPVGGGTMLHLGNPPAKPGHAVDTRALNKVIDYIQSLLFRVPGRKAVPIDSSPVDVPRLPPRLAGPGGAA